MRERPTSYVTFVQLIAVLLCGMLSNTASADKLVYQGQVSWAYSPWYDNPNDAAQWEANQQSASLGGVCGIYYGARRMYYNVTADWLGGTQCGVVLNVACQKADGSVSTADDINDQAWSCPCPDGQLFNSDLKQCMSPPQNLGGGQCDAKSQSCLVSNPINAASGNKYQREVDYTGSNGLVLARYYNSLLKTVPLARSFANVVARPNWGSNWLGTFDRTVQSYYYYGPRALVYRSDGQQLEYIYNGGSYAPNGPSRSKLTQTGSGWTFKDEFTDELETYNTAGVLQTVTTRSGVVYSLIYSDGTTGSNGGVVLDASGNATSTTLPSGLLIRVVDSFGQIVTFGYDSNSRVVLMTDPAGGAYHYGFDSIGNLTSVTQPATPDSPLGAVKQYVYGEAAMGAESYPHALTGIIDQQTQRYASFHYDSTGRAISSEHAGGAQLASIQYNADGSAQVTDALGTARTYSFTTSEGLSQVASVSEPCGTGCTATRSSPHDLIGEVTSVVDKNGNVSCFAYDPNRKLEVVRVEGFAPTSTCPASLSSYLPALNTQERKISTQWHVTFRLPTQIDEAGRRTAFTYDAGGNVLTKTITDLTVSPNTSRTWTYTFDSYGHPLTANGPRTDVSDVTTYAYYNCTTGYQCGQVNTITDALGHVTTYNTYNGDGQPLTITDANGVLTTLAYDALQRLTSRTVGSEVTSFEYWPTGLLKKVTMPDSSFLLYTYDAAHRLTDMNDSTGNHIHYTLDAMGNRTSVQSFDPSSSLTRTRTRVFNTLNQLYQEIGAAGGAPVTTTYGYDNNGNETSIAAPMSRNTGEAYDELNRLTQITDPATGLTKYGYDALDQLISVTDPRNLTTDYTLNGLGDLKQQVSPDTGTTTNTFDSAGNLYTSTDARNAISTYTYDALNRVKTAAFKIGTTTDQTITYNYDAGTNGVGHLTSASDANHSVSWTYDAQGRVLTKTQTIGAVSKSVSYGYTDGLLTSVTTPSNQSVVYTYTNGLVTGVSVNGTTILTNAIYDPFGPIRQWTWGNGTLAIRTYDQDGNIAQVDSAGLRTYAYDDAFRITGVTDTTNSANSWSYGYDSLDRITSANKTGTSIGYTYDSNGNRLTQTGTNPSTYTIAASSNKLISISGTLARSYGYDAVGNTTSDGSHTFAYNNRGRMKSATSGGTTYAYTYNALGQRIKKTGPTRLFYYDEADHYIGEYDSTGALVQETIWMGDTPIAVLTPKTGGVDIFYVHTDHLNMPRRITRPSDNKLRWTYEPEPFGSGVPNQNPQSLGNFTYNLRFPGQYADSETGLRYNYFRDYDATTGRYVESDPIGLMAGVDTYAYTFGNPLKYVDPRGLDVWLEGPSTNEPSFHQSVNVGDPKGSYDSYSYGMNGNGMQGEVYKDESLGGPIEAYKKTTSKQDEDFKKFLERQKGRKGIYGYDDICRSWSQRQFEKAPGTPTKPPVRVVNPHFNVSPSTSRSTTGTSSTTGTGTSR